VVLKKIDHRSNVLTRRKGKKTVLFRIEFPRGLKRFEVS